MKQIEFSNKELELIIVGIGAGTVLPEYEEDEYYADVVPLLHKVEKELGKTMKEVFMERVEKTYKGGKE